MPCQAELCLDPQFACLSMVAVTRKWSAADAVGEHHLRVAGGGWSKQRLCGRQIRRSASVYSWTAG